MPRCSLSMIVKDEEETLARVLADATTFCDEMVVCDTGSTDRTREIAQDAGARIVDFAWIDDFAAARNASLDACTGEWVVWLDADDRVPPAAQAVFAEVIRGLADEIDAIASPYHVEFDERHQGTLVVPRERVFRRSLGGRWEGAIHEGVNLTGYRVGYDHRLVVEHHKTERQVERDTDRNLQIIERLLAAGDRSAYTLLHHARELGRHLRHDEALAAIDEHLACDIPLDHRYDALIHRCRLLTALERIDEARASALEAVRIQPRQPEGWMAAGITYYDEQDFAAAAPFFAGATQATRRPASAMVPTYEPHYTWAPWDYLSVCQGISGEYREAIRSAERALPGNPKPELVKRNIQTWRAQVSAKRKRSGR